MKNKSLNHFIKEAEKVWGPVNSELTKKSKQLLKELTLNCVGEEWIQDLLKEKLPFKEVYRSEKHGFILMGHVEGKGTVSPPHDHGDGWVLYGTVLGKSRMGLFNKVTYPNGDTNLVQKDQYFLNPGDVSVYLPGDIHDTFTPVDDTVLLRLTSCDFMREVEEGRLNRYPDYNEFW